MNKKNTLFSKILLTILLLIGYRLLSFVTIPWIDTSSLALLSNYSFFAYLNEFNGGTLSTLSVTAVGISAYISASIVIQLLSFGIPRLEEISRQPGGDKVIKKITIVLGIILSLITSIGMVKLLDSQFNILISHEWYVIPSIAIIHCLGSSVAIWVGETITEKGFGNGVSLLIALNIATKLPSNISEIFNSEINRSLLISGIILIMFIMVVILETAEERVPVQYSSRINSSSIYKTRDPYIPIKLNVSSVMPIIFATTFFQLISAVITIGKFENIPNWLTSAITYGTVPYMIITCVGIILFTFFYSMIIFKPDEIATQLQINEGVIPGVRPGSDTENYLKRIIFKLNIIGSIYMCAATLIPMICFKLLNFSSIQVTSLIILVGVGLEVSNKILIEMNCKPAKKLFDITAFVKKTAKI